MNEADKNLVKARAVLEAHAKLCEGTVHFEDKPSETLNAPLASAIRTVLSGDRLEALTREQKGEREVDPWSVGADVTRPSPPNPTPPEADAELTPEQEAIRESAKGHAENVRKVFGDADMVARIRGVIRILLSEPAPDPADWTVRFIEDVIALIDRLTELEREQQHSLEVIAEGYARAEAAEATLASTQAKLEAARGALEPFAYLMTEVELEEGYDCPKWKAKLEDYISVVDFREARAALQETAQ